MARPLRRKTREAVLCGVAAGYAEYLDVDPVLVRLAFVFLCFFGGIGAAIYLVSWLLMPRDEAGEGGAAPLDRLAQEAASAGERVAEAVRKPEGSGRGRLVGGLILILLGVAFLADRFLPYWWWRLTDLWPLVLIAIGVALVAGARRGGSR